MDDWKKATEELAEELRRLVNSAGGAANTALRINSLGLYHRFVWEESRIGEPEVIRRVMDFALDNPDILRKIHNEWHARRTAIANAGSEFRGAVKGAADKFLQTVQENGLTS